MNSVKTFYATYRKTVLAVIAALLIGLGYGAEAIGILDLFDDIEGDVGTIAGDLSDEIEGQLGQ